MLGGRSGARSRVGLYLSGGRGKGERGGKKREEEEKFEKGRMGERENEGQKKGGMRGGGRGRYLRKGGGE